MIKNEKDIEVNNKEMSSIMKKELNMRYRKIKDITKNSNSEKNQVLRQQFALNLIKILQMGKRIINVDETWINMQDFRRRKWRPHGSTNSVSKTSIGPRITMIAALDTDGELYLSLL